VPGSIPRTAALPERHGLSLFIRVAAFVFVVMATIVSTLTGISYLAARRIIREQVEQRLLLAANQRAQAMDTYIRQQHERVRLIASRTQLRRHLEEWNAGEIEADPFQTAMDRILTDAMYGSEDIQEIWITDAQGSIVAATNSARIGGDQSNDNGFLAGRQGPYLSELRRYDRQLLCHLSAPALDQHGQLLGVIQVVILTTRLVELVLDPAGLGTTGEALVGRREGSDRVRYLLPSRQTSAESVAAEAVPSMIKAIDGHDGFEVAMYASQEVLIAFEPVPFQRGVDWGLVVKITSDEAYTPLKNLRRVVLPLGLLLLIPAVLSAYWLANRYASPIMQLAESAGILAGGQLKHRVPVTGDDEIAILSRAFNDMASQLEALYDVLERRVAERTNELSRANRALERSNRDLEQFAYVASHDLQEPLRAISGFAQLLSDQTNNQLSPQNHEYLQFIVESANRMKLLIDHLLEYSRVCSLGAPPEWVDSRQAFRHALNNLRTTIEQRQAVVTSEGLGNVLADLSQLTQLFQNVIGNAIKFCNQHPPRVHVLAEYAKDEVTFAISDNGIGIDPKDSGRIFTIFRRLHSSDAYAGTGIGLAICQQIVQRHGGRIWVESEPGQGSTFFFTLRLASNEVGRIPANRVH
jgi:signal transduction histidine kinase